MSTKPGVMIYFEIADIVNEMTDKQAGILFRSILEYGATRQIPELPSSIRLVWPLIQMRLDNDDQRYIQITQKKRYAAYTRWAKAQNKKVEPFDYWVTDIDNPYETYDLNTF